MRRHAAFIVILITTAFARFVVLFLSQRHVISDEAIVGLMAKHILEGRYFPFYLHGVPYSGSGAWEAYLAVAPFALFGINVIALKSVTVLLSLITLILFYLMAAELYGRRLAALASLIFAFWPGLWKWHFQAKGYAFYFISIPLLIFLFARLQRAPLLRNEFLFGLVCGLGIWSLEIILPIIAALWLLLLAQRHFRGLAMSIFGCIIGYAPVIWWNFVHGFANWQFVFFERVGPGSFRARLSPSAWWEILANEMPKFFGPDTVLWYYAEKSWTGYAMYAVVIVGVVLAGFRALRSNVIRNALTSGFSQTEVTSDLLMLVLTGAAFAMYIIAPFRVPGYFLVAAFFMSILIARAADAGRIGSFLPHLPVGIMLLTVAVCDAHVVFRSATENQIETLAVVKPPLGQQMTRILGRDIDAVENDLKQHKIGSVWTTLSFVYPLIFESGEKLIASESIFGVERSFYPPEIPKPEPNQNEPAVFVIETQSPYREQIESTLALKSNAPPQIREHGTLTVIEQRFASDSQQ